MFEAFSENLTSNELTNIWTTASMTNITVVSKIWYIRNGKRWANNQPIQNKKMTTGWSTPDYKRDRDKNDSIMISNLWFPCVKRYILSIIICIQPYNCVNLIEVVEARARIKEP